MKHQQQPGTRIVGEIMHLPLAVGKRKRYCSFSGQIHGISPLTKSPAQSIKKGRSPCLLQIFPNAACVLYQPLQPLFPGFFFFSSSFFLAFAASSSGVPLLSTAFSSPALAFSSVLTALPLLPPQPLAPTALVAEVATPAPASRLAMPNPAKNFFRSFASIHPSLQLLAHWENEATGVFRPSLDRFRIELPHPGIAILSENPMPEATKKSALQLSGYSSG